MQSNIARILYKMARETLNTEFKTFPSSFRCSKVFHGNSVGRLNTVAHAQFLVGWLLPHLENNTQDTVRAYG